MTDRGREKAETERVGGISFRIQAQLKSLLNKIKDSCQIRLLSTLVEGMQMALSVMKSKVHSYWRIEVVIRFFKLTV